MSHAIALPIWKRRYLLLILTLLYLGGTNGWLVYKGQWNAFTTQVFLANNTLGGSLLLGYMGFAAWDDKNHMNACVQDRRRRRQEDDEPEADR